MEDKLMKCVECDAKFSSAELLQVHQRRHEMTLNLSTKPLASLVTGTSASLSTPSVSKGSHSAGIIGCFVDETPTPTRFIRNCEEVGLFQDLQHVNPFDEDFKKAAATPSVGESFEFTFSTSAIIGAPGTPTNLQETAHSLRTPTRSKRRYSDQDTLNTPQVFPYFNFNSTGTYQSTTITTQTTTPSLIIPSGLTPTTHSSHIGTETVRNGNVIQCHQTTPPIVPLVSNTSYNHEEHVSIIAHTSAISQQTNPNKNKEDISKKVESPKIITSVSVSELIKSVTLTQTLNPINITTTTAPSINSDTNTNSHAFRSLLKIRSKSHLKLDLKHVTSRNKTSHGSSKCSTSANDSNSVGKRPKIKLIRPSEIKQVENPTQSITLVEGKSELLERNRAAAHRSRERRKEWIYGLESRCRALETLLAETQAEVVRLKAENDSLKSQLGKDTVTGGKESKMEEASPICPIIPLANETKGSSSTTTSIIIPQVVNGGETRAIFQEPLTVKNGEVSDLEGGLVAAIISPIVLPTVKAKRGRPRKGEERRVPIQSVPITGSANDAKTKALPKIPILPLTRTKSK